MKTTKLLSEEAKEVAINMIEFCIRNCYCMGMGEGFNDDDSKEAFRIELESLVKANLRNVNIIYK